MSLHLSPTYRALLRFSVCLSVPPDEEEERVTHESPKCTQERAEPEAPISYRERLLYYRKIRGWSRQDLAEAIFEACSHAQVPRYVGINPKNIGRWERGESKPDSFYIRYLCQVYEVPADKLGLM